MGLLSALVVGAAYEAEEARRRRSAQEPVPIGTYWRAAQSCYPGVFAPRELARGIAEVEAVERRLAADRAALEAYRNPKCAHPAVNTARGIPIRPPVWYTPGRAGERSLPRNEGQRKRS